MGEWYMFIDQFALQHIADRSGYYSTNNEHHFYRFDLSKFPHGDVSIRTSVKGGYLKDASKAVQKPY